MKALIIENDEIEQNHLRDSPDDPFRPHPAVPSFALTALPCALCFVPCALVGSRVPSQP